jgi:hypothetical protein
MRHNQAITPAGNVNDLVRARGCGGTAEHIAERPSWDCRACDKPWPCDPARERLMLEMDRVPLAIYMWVNLEEAARDMPLGPVAELFERFIKWTH